MMSPKPIGEDRVSSNIRHTPLQIIHVIGNFLRIWSVYSMYRYLTQTGASVALFIFCCLLPSSLLFLVMQRPWKGRPLSNQQVVPSIINGVITALYFSMWGKGLKSCGPVRTILAEYAGAVLGVLSAVLYGRGSHVWKKVLGDENKIQLPFSAWAFGSFIIFGIILIFFIDSIAEERLHMVFSSPRHLMVAGGCIIILETLYKMDFSLPGFIICSLILGFGIYEATALERGKKGTQHFDPADEILEDEMRKSPLPN
ncbi:hypothetical protein LINPERPRIM_LOCUS2798 [Linum perenne]